MCARACVRTCVRTYVHVCVYVRCGSVRKRVLNTFAWMCIVRCRSSPIVLHSANRQCLTRNIGAKLCEVVHFLVGPGDRGCTDLRGSEGVAIAVARHLASAADIMVADGLPPDDRNGVVQGVYVVVHSSHVYLQLQLLKSKQKLNQYHKTLCF